MKLRSTAIDQDFPTNFFFTNFWNLFKRFAHVIYLQYRISLWRSIERLRVNFREDLRQKKNALLKFLHDCCCACILTLCQNVKAVFVKTTQVKLIWCFLDISHRLHLVKFIALLLISLLLYPPVILVSITTSRMMK